MTREEFLERYPFLNSKEIAKCRFTSFGNGYKFIRVENFQGDCGLFDEEGKIIVPVMYKTIEVFDGFIIAGNSCCSVVYDYEGNQILPISKTYAYVSEFGKYIFQGVEIESKVYTKVYDKTGKEFVPGEVYEDVFAQHEEFLAVKHNGHWKVLYTI